MLYEAFAAAAMALADATLVAAQTSTDCNPLKKPCPADPALGNGNGSCDFTKGECSAFDTLRGTALSYNNSYGAAFQIRTEKDAPTIRTGKYIFFGRIDVVVQAAAGAGIVTSAVLQSDDLDEIDWEWVGGDNTQAQTNYFSKGDTATYDRGVFHTVSNPTGAFHTYSVEWNSQGVTWLIDNSVVRTLTAAQAHGAAFLPQTPMQVKLGTWVAGRKDASPGTVQWAGGYADFSKAPFLSYYKSISVVDYAGSDVPTSKSVKEYIYADRSGSWESIVVETGDGSETNSKAAPSTTSRSQAPSSAEEPSKTSASSTSDDWTTASAARTTSFTTAAFTGSGSGSNSTGTGAASPTSAGRAVSTTMPGNAGSRSAATIGSILAAGVVLARLLR